MGEMNKSTFIVSQMDCPSEEQMIRMKIENLKYITLKGMRKSKPRFQN